MRTSVYPVFSVQCLVRVPWIHPRQQTYPVLISSLPPTVKVNDKCLVRSACQSTDLFELSKLPANIGLLDTRINEKDVLYLFASHSSKGEERIIPL